MPARESPRTSSRTRGLNPGRPIEDAGADEAVQRRDRQAAVGHSRGDDHRPGRRLAVVGQRYDALIAAAAQLGRLVGEDELGPEEHRLLPGPVRQGAAADALRKAKIVADHGACAGLAADRVRFEQDGAQPFRRAGDRGR
jgi:hypothetical protein